MTCGLLDLGCHIHNLIAPFWFWIVVAFWIVVGLVALFVLAKINEVFGWRGVVAAVSAGLAATIYTAGFRRGREGRNYIPLPGEKTPDAVIITKKRPRKPVGTKAGEPDPLQPPTSLSG